MLTTSAVDEIVNFIAGENPAALLDFKASEDTKKRAFDLMERSKRDELSEKEQAELDQYLLLEHLMRLALGQDRNNIVEEVRRMEIFGNIFSQLECFAKTLLESVLREKCKPYRRWQ